jgi:hypothetical protein
MVQENYLLTKPVMGVDRRSDLHTELRTMEMAAAAAASLAESDLLERKVRTDQSWGLLSAVGILSCVRPSHFMHGQLG